METTVWKYPLEVTDEQKINIPDQHTCLCIQTQNGTPCLWALVDPDAPKIAKTIKVVGTGHHRPDVNGSQYVGTFQLHGGQLVFHVFA